MLVFSNDTTTPQIYTLSLHDALPISISGAAESGWGIEQHATYIISFESYGVNTGDLRKDDVGGVLLEDRKSTRLNSSHLGISYAVFCLKKKKKRMTHSSTTTRASSPS